MPRGLIEFDVHVILDALVEVGLFAGVEGGDSGGGEGWGVRVCLG
jgi:hypothetical protein